VSESEDTLLLRGMVADLIEPIWRTEFYNDVEGAITYKDAKKKDPRSEEEIEQITSELDMLKNDLIEEIVEDLRNAKITKVEDIANSYKEVQKICHQGFAKYRRRLWDVVKPALPAE